jgi:hypothetical protein
MSNTIGSPGSNVHLDRILSPATGGAGATSRFSHVELERSPAPKTTGTLAELQWNTLAPHFAPDVSHANAESAMNVFNRNSKLGHLHQFHVRISDLLAIK